METEKGLLLGKGRYRLLRAIQEQGSINKAAQSLHLSYKKAWRQINDINANASEEVVKRSIGGKGGGGTHLTAFGRELLEGYEALEQSCELFLKQQAELLFNEI